MAPGDFVGPEACEGCHTEKYRAWAGSTHGRAGGEAGPDVAIAPFDGSPITFADARVVPRVLDDGSYVFVVRRDAFDPDTVPVDGVVGGGHMIGGGTQGFLSRHSDGTIRFLPFDWSRDEARWFCNTGSRTDQGWVPITPAMHLADCGDWPPIRVLGVESRFGNCQGCHGSQVRTRFEPDSGRYSTTHGGLEINCESCHGPARRHVELMEAEELGPGGGVGLESLVTLEKDRSLEVCFRCHALKDVVKEDFLPGDDFQRHYALKFPILGDRPYLSDFRIRSFAYQGTHLASACYLEGAMTCVSCHEPHGQGYWDEWRRPLDGPFDDGQCTACHPSKAGDVEAHTFHPPESEGSRCVGCHMPYLQHPEVGPEVRFSRSDHTIPVPRPGFDAGQGIEGACAQCHDDRTSRELEEQARAWWGRLKPHRPLIQGLIEATEVRSRFSRLDRAEEADLILRPDEHDPLAQFAGLARLFTTRLTPDDQRLEPLVVDRLTRLTESPDLDVRALALASLHWARGRDPEVRKLLADHLAKAPDADDPLRRRWVMALAFLGDDLADRGRPGTGLVAYEKALEVVPRDPDLLLNRGLIRNGMGDPGSAERDLRASLEVDPNQPLAWVNLGISLAGQDRSDEALRAYDRALEINPVEPLAWFNKGNVHLRHREVELAREAYEEAVRLDPSLARAHLYLARAYGALGRLDEARREAGWAVDLAPEDPSARRLLEDLGGG